jgi:haloacetate dehalogenase
VFEGFVERVIDVGQASILTRHRPGHGMPVLLLHGHPRTSATWHRVAPILAETGMPVVCADLRGYGRSIGPPPAPDHVPHSKRVVAADMVAVMRDLGYEQFALVGHDRGSYVALRLALDNPDTVTRLSVLDCIPISEHLDRLDERFGTAWWHWFFFAQPEMPERVINADPEGWYRADPDRMGAENYAEWLTCVRRPAVVRAMLEDYRAGLTIDAAAEREDRLAGRRLRMPVQVLWSLHDDLESLYGDPLQIGESWAQDIRGHGIDSGHHMAEDAPEELARALMAFAREVEASD